MLPLLLVIAALLLLSAGGIGIFLALRFRPERKARRALNNLMKTLQPEGLPWEDSYRQGIARLEKALEEGEDLIREFPESLAAGKLEAGDPAQGLRPLKDFREKILPRWRRLAEEEEDPLLLAEAALSTWEDRPAAAALLLKIARFHLQTGQLERALTTARRAEQAQQPPAQALWATLAQIYYHQGRREETQALLASRMEPSLLKIEVLCSLQGRRHREQALREIGLIQEEKEKEQALRLLSEALLEEDQTTQVRELLSRSPASALTDEILLSLVKAYLQQHRRDQAGEILKAFPSPRVSAFLHLTDQDPEALKKTEKPELLLEAAGLLADSDQSSQAYPLLLRARSLLSQRVPDQSEPREKRAYRLRLWVTLFQRARQTGKEDLARQALRQAWQAADGKLELMVLLPWRELSESRRDRLKELTRALPPEKLSAPLAALLIDQFLPLQNYTAALKIIRGRPSLRETVSLLIELGAGLRRHEGNTTFEWSPEELRLLHQLHLRLIP